MYCLLRVNGRFHKDVREKTLRNTLQSCYRPLVLHVLLFRRKNCTLNYTNVILSEHQVYKATADYAAAKEMYDHYAAVTDAQPPHFLSLRSIVLDRKQPRKLFVQCNTERKGKLGN